jgi:hypothetical protein
VRETGKAEAERAAREGALSCSPNRHRNGGPKRPRLAQKYHESGAASLVMRRAELVGGDVHQNQSNVEHSA